MTGYTLPILNEREKTHGDFQAQSKTAQGLKHKLKNTPNWEVLPAATKESIDLICTKLARIAHGDYQCADHFADIAGYATLIADSLKK